MEKYNHNLIVKSLENIDPKELNKINFINSDIKKIIKDNSNIFNSKKCYILSNINEFLIEINNFTSSGYYFESQLHNYIIDLKNDEFKFFDVKNNTNFCIEINSSQDITNIVEKLLNLNNFTLTEIRIFCLIIQQLTTIFTENKLTTIKLKNKYYIFSENSIKIVDKQNEIYLNFMNLNLDEKLNLIYFYVINEN